MLAQAYLRLGGAIALIGCGEVEDAATALAKIEAGANLVQLYTSLALKGVGVVAEILDGLREAVEARGVASVSALAGTRAREWAGSDPPGRSARRLPKEPPDVESPKLSAFPKARIEALGDGVFSVAMTLLALDVRFPDDFQPKSSAEFLAGAAALWPKFFPYALSFWVLGARWLALIQIRTGDRDYETGYRRWWLLYLFLVTCVPFTTIAFGRYASLAPAIWFYAGNAALIGLVSFRAGPPYAGQSRPPHGRSAADRHGDPCPLVDRGDRLELCRPGKGAVRLPA